MCVQVCQAEWVVTRGGLVPKLLHPDVVRGAANVASLRRLRYLVHGATALRYTKLGLRFSRFYALLQFSACDFSCGATLLACKGLRSRQGLMNLRFLSELLLPSL